MHKRIGLTLIELLVIIAIITILVGLLLPAVQKVRDAGVRVQCANNLKQLGIAINCYFIANKEFPTAGVNPNGQQMAFSTQSLFTSLLPYLEQENTYRMMDITKCYNNPVNIPAAQTNIGLFLCPANPLNTLDGQGYGKADYAATIYTDIDPQTGQRNPKILTDGALSGFLVQNPDGSLNYKGAKAKDIMDGTSRTIAIGEVVGRGDGYYSPFVDPQTRDARATWRWAEPASSIIVSGPINNHFLPMGGGEDYRWSKTYNCGNNDEIFSFHPGGAQVVFCDGHTEFLLQALDPLFCECL